MAGILTFIKNNRLEATGYILFGVYVLTLLTLVVLAGTFQTHELEEAAKYGMFSLMFLFLGMAVGSAYKGLRS